MINLAQMEQVRIILDDIYHKTRDKIAHLG